MVKRIRIIFLSILLIFVCSSSNLYSLSRPGNRSSGDILYNGNDNGEDIMLQGFHWGSHSGAGSLRWYEYLSSIKDEIKQYYTAIWLPPPSETADIWGYMPADWANLNSNYGTKTQLKTLISKLHDTSGNQKWVAALADVVVNHRSGKSTCSHNRYVIYDYSNFGIDESELIDGEHEGDPDDGSCDCIQSGFTEGTWEIHGRRYKNEDFIGSPDLNHWKSSTRSKIKAWLDYLKDSNNAGYDGWRFDMIGGYDPKFLAEYNYHTNPYLSVGEKPACDPQYLMDIVNRAEDKTMVFDFNLKCNMNYAFRNKSSFNGLDIAYGTGVNNLKGMVKYWPQAAVTFVENHDTGDHNYGGHWACGGPIGAGYPDQTYENECSMMAAYALILTHPGIPCVFYSDWKDRGGRVENCIEKLIKIRRSNNIKRWSRFYVAEAKNDMYAAYVGDENAEQLAIKIGIQGKGDYENWVPASHLGLTKTYTEWTPNGYAFCVYYKNLEQ